jgi:uncharacterized OB-fold protein
MSASTDFTHTAFTRHLLDHKLMGVRAQGIGTILLPPRPLGPGETICSMEWVPLAGTGTLEAFSIIHIAPSAMIQEGYGRDNPYCAGIVRLTEGPAISAQILGVDIRTPESIRIGTKVSVEFIDSGEGEQKKTRLAFRVK